MAMNLDEKEKINNQSIIQVHKEKYITTQAEKKPKQKQKTDKHKSIRIQNNIKKLKKIK
jgi:cytochrome c-type biogenesis protein CcmE